MNNPENWQHCVPKTGNLEHKDIW